MLKLLVMMFLTISSLAQVGSPGNGRGAAPSEEPQMERKHGVFRDLVNLFSYFDSDSKLRSKREDLCDDATLVAYNGDAKPYLRQCNPRSEVRKRANACGSMCERESKSTPEKKPGKRQVRVEDNRFLHADFRRIERVELTELQRISRSQQPGDEVVKIKRSVDSTDWL